jgi:hypothetical protein
MSPGSTKQIDSLKGGLVVAIDLGFSKTRKSCGIAWREGSARSYGESLRFGECAKRVASLFEAHSRGTLIVEAPLSGKFTSAGDPIERGGFERKGGSLSKGTHRHWYAGGGGVMCLAAIFFLRELLDEFQHLSDHAEEKEITLFEGFVTFKPEATRDVVDAQLLVDSFMGSHDHTVIEVTACDGEAVVTVSDIVAGQISEPVAPAIIVPSKSSG